MQKKRNIGILLTLLLVWIITSCCNDSIGFIEEEVIFKNEIDNTTLAGTLTIPIGEDNYPFAILISGSGQQDRDETVYGHKPFKALAEFLSINGIGVLRYDDRGIGGSIGNVWNATLDVQAKDAYAAVRYLKARDDLNLKSVGIIGHSLGAMQGTILASQNSDISFLIMLGGIGIPFSDNQVKADRLTNEIKGEDIEIIEAGSALLTSIFEELESVQDNEDYQTIKGRLIQITDEWQLSLSGTAKAEIEKFTRSNPNFWIDNIAGEYATPIYISCVKYNPADYLSKIKCPVLSIIGEKDIQVVPENNKAIEKHLIRGGNTKYLIATPKGINHILQKCEIGLISEYEKLDEDINPVILELILEWLNSITADCIVQIP